MRTFIFPVIVALVASIFSSSLSAQICYKVEREDLPAPSYLFGTHHLAPLSVYDSIPQAKEGFRQARRIVGEIDMRLMEDMATAMEMQQYAIAPADSALTDLLSEEDLNTYSRKFAEFVPQVPLVALAGMRPMVATTLLTVNVVQQNLPEFRADEQLDTWFQYQGALEGKEITALETPAQQARILYQGLSIPAQLRQLTHSLDNPQELVEKSRQLNAAYMSRDLKAMESLESDEEDPEVKIFMEALVNKRNADWLEKLPSIMGSEPSFIAVGALHLAGEEGLVEGLRRMGYTVTPLDR